MNAVLFDGQAKDPLQLLPLGINLLWRIKEIKQVEWSGAGGMCRQ